MLPSEQFAMAVRPVTEGSTGKYRLCINQLFSLNTLKLAIAVELNGSGPVFDLVDLFDFLD